jgi:hypothetical protein
MDFTRLQELGTRSFITVCCSWVLRDALQTQLFIAEMLKVVTNLL